MSMPELFRAMVRVFKKDKPHMVLRAVLMFREDTNHGFALTAVPPSKAAGGDDQRLLSVDALTFPCRGSCLHETQTT